MIAAMLLSTVILASTVPAKTPAPALEMITLGGGCFWCTEAVFLDVVGVKSVASGYTGGSIANPMTVADSTMAVLLRGSHHHSVSHGR